MLIEFSFLALCFSFLCSVLRWLSHDAAGRGCGPLGGGARLRAPKDALRKQREGRVSGLNRFFATVSIEGTRTSEAKDMCGCSVAKVRRMLCGEEVQCTSEAKQKRLWRTKIRRTLGV